MLKQKMWNIPLSRDEGQCAAVVRGVRKITKLPTLAYTIRSQFRACNALHYLFPQGLVPKCPHRDEPSEKKYTGLPHQHDKAKQLHTQGERMPGKNILTEIFHNNPRGNVSGMLVMSQ